MTDGLQAALAARYPPYREEGAVVAAIRLTPTRVTGWAAG
jgi:hypothetical protein